MLPMAIEVTSTVPTEFIIIITITVLYNGHHNIPHLIVIIKTVGVFLESD